MIIEEISDGKTPERILIVLMGSDAPEFTWPDDPTYSFFLEQVTIHLEFKIYSIGDPARLEIVTPGSLTNTTIVSADLGESHDTDMIWIPEKPIFLQKGEQIYAASGNSERVPYLIRMVVRKND